MKDIVIKILIVLLAVLAYFNVTQYVETKQLEHENALLQNAIAQLEELQKQQDNNGEQGDTCQKLYEITIQVIVEKEDFEQSYILCTNQTFLGGALEEAQEDLEVVFDPRYDKDYVYGRMAASFYGYAKEYEEFYRITINGVYSNKGLDFVELEDDTSYEFTLVRWS